MRCPYCNQASMIRNGFRQNKLGNRQIFRCKACTRCFSEPFAKGNVYPIDMIARAISLYNRGYTLSQIQKEIFRHRRHVPRSTIYSWIKRYRSFFTFSKSRHLLKNKDPICSRLFYHPQLYNFQYHELKLMFLKDQKMSDYIGRVYHDPFFDTIHERKRCSQVSKDIKNNATTKTRHNITQQFVQIALDMIETNKQRHTMVQELMLINDSATFAVELPVYDDHLLGHIDILQFRFGTYHILDYKPDISKEAVSQVLLYKELFTKNTGISKEKVKAACFNEHEYVEIIE